MYRCCCCSVSVGSRIFATLTAIGAFFALIGNFGTVSGWYYWLFNAIFLIIDFIAAILVFVAVKRRNPTYMIPILVITVVNEIMGLVYLGFAIAAIFADGSPLAASLINFYNSLPGFQDSLNYWGITVNDFVSAYAISLSIGIFIAILFNIWVFVTHFQTYKMLKERMHHCDDHFHNIPPSHIVPASYPPPSSGYPSADPCPYPQSSMYATQSAPSAPPVDTLAYPTGYRFNHEEKRVEQVWS
ncbi:hypothetical protein PRIPAC_81291 [Pristionchus pacificus]|uniref:Uncharacterized protein n=1 Tax=Pristionchus pacificus TaxID=54126 RepID=A0A2A6BXW3_PRIPA|nr:hypothetical protein PRIPAC_81291 [Pristionchus pacificus]|eukprot:PDM70750.1 hypothetical protein PRIPAC_44954 [Pristionchus pacificus]